MVNVRTLTTGTVIAPTYMNARSTDRSCVVNASALKAIWQSQVYVEGRSVSRTDFVVVSGLTSCTGLLLACSGRYLVAAHFNGGQNDDAEWGKIVDLVGGTPVTTAVVIINDMNWLMRDIMNEYIEVISPGRILYYDPYIEGAPVALRGDGEFGELAS